MPEAAVVESEVDAVETSPPATDDTPEVVEETSAYEVMLMQMLGY